MFKGSSASATNFQAYLLEGLTRWNADRHAATETNSQIRCYDSRLNNTVNRLSTPVLSKQLVPGFGVPGKYTGNLVLAYLLFLKTG